MAEKKRKRWNRAAKASQFTRGAGGELVYTGRYYTFCSQEKEEYRRSMRTQYTLAAISALAVVAGGVIPVSSLLNTWYVILPYLFTLLGEVSVVWALCRMSMCTRCGQIWYLVVGGAQEGSFSCNLVFLALQVVVFMSMALMRRAEIQWKWSM